MALIALKTLKALIALVKLTKDTDVIDNEENDDDTMNKFDDDFAKDAIGAKYMQMDRSGCFLKHDVFVVEAPVLEHNRQEVKKAKVK